MKTLPKLLISVALFASPAFAGDLFQIDGFLGAPPPTVTVGSSNALDLIEGLVNNAGAFSAFSGQSYSAEMTYFGYRNAIFFDQNFAPGNVSFLIHFTPIDQIVNFNGATEEEVWAQVKDYFEKDTSGTYSRFLKALGAQSTTAITDGNPNATTAIAAKNVFQANGFTPSQSLSFGDEADASDISTGGASDSLGERRRGDPRNPSPSRNPNQPGSPDNAEAKEEAGKRPSFKTYGLGFNSGRFAAEVQGQTFRGQYTEVGFSWLNLDLSDAVRLEAPVSFNWMTLEGTDAYGITQGLALPIQLSLMDVVTPLNWRVTPVAGVSARVSPDALSGAVMWYAGATHSLDYRVNKKLVVSMVNQLTTHQGLPVTYKTYSFDSEVNQWILKNGVKLTTPLARRVIGDVYLIDTQFLKDAAVDSFESVGGSVSWRATENFNLSVAANYDFGNNFDSWSVGISSAWLW